MFFKGLVFGVGQWNPSTAQWTPHKSLLRCGGHILYLVVHSCWL